MNKKPILSIFLIIILISSGCVGGNENSKILGTEYKDPPLAPDFILTNQFGDLVTFSDYEGKVIVVAFIYTTCPDVCLIISANLDYIHNNLGEYSEDVVILSITIDPARDTVPHISEWTKRMGYEWNHLTHETSSVIEDVWNTWNVVVDNDHIANSLAPEADLLRFAVLNPDNSSFKSDSKCWNLQDSSCYLDLDDFANYSFNQNTDEFYNMSDGSIGEWKSNDNWTWELHNWDLLNESWIKINNDMFDTKSIPKDTNLAWVASNANISNLPPGIDCNGNGWIMGSGTSSHCMCDEEYERPNDNWISCVSKNDLNNENISEIVDPHAETLGEYEIGHSTSTYIIDKNMNKRVSYSGINWDAGDFLMDVITLSNE